MRMLAIFTRRARRVRGRRAATMLQSSTTRACMTRRPTSAADRMPRASPNPDTPTTRSSTRARPRRRSTRHAPAASAARRWLAAVAALIAASRGARGCRVEAEHASNPSSTHLGWPVDLTGFVQVDAVAWSAGTRSTSSIRRPASRSNEEHFCIPRAALRVEARRDALYRRDRARGNTSRRRPLARAERSVGWLVPALQRRDRRSSTSPAGCSGSRSARASRRTPRDRPFLELPTFAARAVPRRPRRRRAWRAAHTASLRWSRRRDERRAGRRRAVEGPRSVGELRPRRPARRATCTRAATTRTSRPACRR